MARNEILRDNVAFERDHVTNLLNFSRIVDITQERGIGGLYILGFKKGFDRVPHKKSMWRLENLGDLGGYIKEWVKDYLDGRQTRTGRRWKRKIEGDQHNITGINAGTIIVLVYVNDMPEGVGSYISILADNAKLLRRIKSEADCKEMLKNTLYEWSKIWAMESNAKEMPSGENRKETHVDL